MRPLGPTPVNGAQPGKATEPQHPGDSFDRALMRAVRLLSRREHGRAELEAKLVARGVEADVARSVLDKLRDDGLQSDERFAEALVRRRIERGYGPVYIRGELRERRVDDAVIDTRIDCTDEFWLQRAELALAKKFPPGNDNDAGVEYNKRARFLARRGFPAELVHRALRAATPPA